MQRKMRATVILFSSALAAFLAGCGGSPTYTIAEGNLAGKIDGKDYTFVSGYTDDFLSKSDKYFTTLYSEKVDSCTAFPAGDLKVLLQVPKEVGDYELSLSHNVTLANGSNNYIALTGLLSVTKVSDTSIEAGVHAIFEDKPDDEVNGHFTATVCPPN